MISWLLDLCIDALTFIVVALIPEAYPCDWEEEDNDVR